SPSRWFKEFGISITMAVLVHIVFKGWIASEAASRFTHDRRSGALELILSTPLTVHEILHGYYLSLFKQFAWPLVGVLCFDVFLFLMADTTGTANEDIVLVGVVGEITFFVDIVALVLVSMWQSMLATKVNNAAGASVARVMLLPWIIFFALLTGVNLLDFNIDQHGTLWTWIWAIISVGNSVLFARQAWRKLENDFRATATLRMVKSTPIRNFFRLIFSGKKTPTSQP
ncbi:MAG: hypothetical protein JWN25_1928, partial [Verrucomicrobiales bacterium]|nr:hypothetical protein [Verrucomicrobiales bacterium]